MKTFPSLPTSALLLLAVLAAGAGACSHPPKGNSSAQPHFSNTVPDRAQGRNSRGTPQQTGQSQDVTNNRR